ncbi:hypothetical protein ACAX43_32330 [Paraburkholderia sp. IW21]|uniref:hypothetical protein n=1 Tax=Paraburkholderia sp. IW21 TaxID=3242488 RepID=UPI003522FD07
MKSDLWFFNDPPNVAAIASKDVLCGRDWIDDEDGARQFHALNLAGKKAMPSW